MAQDEVQGSGRERQLNDWNRTAAPYPRLCLHELIDEQAQRTPQAVAVRCHEDRLTYATLAARANQLGHHLRALGVGPDVLVGVALERSCEMLVALLGVLKAGGAYVPVDPAYPAERQRFMLERSQAPVLITQQRLLGALPDTGAHVVCIDRDWPQLATLPDHAPPSGAQPEHLAYVIYTSGSTGEPKGVQIPHRAIVNFLTAMAREPGLRPDDVLLAVTTLSFDIAGLELYLPLTVGAQVVIAPSATAADPAGLAALLAASGTTVMQATPTTWRMLVDSGWAGREGLKALCGGEALPPGLAQALVERGLELWNMYGPTETTVWSTCTRVGGEEAPVTIGRPIANTTLYILDEDMALAPIGEPGELWIGGDGLARGYRGRPDLTRERFLDSPFAAPDGVPRGDGRIYRTGDVARWRSDGRVEFLGRSDQQVKVRGFRIELGEIEAALTRHPGVSEAVVVARGRDADAQLAAYVTAAGEPPDAHELRELAAGSLPAYMVPATVTVLQAFPLTPNGKVDRKALPEPVRERSSAQEVLAPRTPLERKLTAIWERQLKISPISIRDNFFDLGVSSIVAAQLFATIEHEIGDALPLGAIFKAPTIERLAWLISEGANTARWSSLVPIQPQGTRTPVFCVHGGAGTVLHLEPLARRLGPDQPFYGLQSRGLYGRTAPLQTVQEMATHYLSEMREVNPDGPWLITGYCFGAIVAFELAQRLRAQGEEVRLLASFNGPSPFWIRRWGWYGAQPSQVSKHRGPTRRMTRGARLVRAIREPRRFVTGALWKVRVPRARLALKYGRPLPESLRESYFFRLHNAAERAYEPAPYPGEMLVFYGSGLYDDPTLGWGDVAQVRSFAVPGQHDNNRQAMTAPGVDFVGEQLRAYLAA